MTTPATFQITEGPSREELFDALRLRHETRKVTLTVESPFHPQGIFFEVFVNGISIEDGSGNSWNLELYHMYSKNPFGLQYFKAYFNTQRRKGVLTPLKSNS